jgi:DMSO/TMAO reductase YedYZ molybdopterin-dependent catalytic subunit
MPARQERGLLELAHEDPERAAAFLGARHGRRRFARVLGSATVGFFAAEVMPFAGRQPPGWVPAALADETEPFVIEGKDDLIVLNDRPVNAETPVTRLDDDLTPNRLHFVRNNGLVPERATRRDLTGWTLKIDGEVERELTLGLDDLKRGYRQQLARLTLECGGNGRAGFRPRARGNQWKLGAVGCAEYRGVRLKDVLVRAGVKPSAVYVGYYGEDPHLSGTPGEVAISRGVPIRKALDDHTLLAWEMNGEALPALHGFPLQLVAPGWPASASGKWLRRLWIRDRVHDGPKMGGMSYRVPRYPVAPGTEVPEAEMEIIEAMPVKSIITRPASGVEHPAAAPFHLRGHAWSGDGPVRALHVSLDFGATWTEAELLAPANPFAWQRWRAELRFPIRGYYEVFARATGRDGRQQPMVMPGWNPRGYLNNAMHRIAVRVV